MGSIRGKDGESSSWLCDLGRFLPLSGLQLPQSPCTAPGLLICDSEEADSSSQMCQRPLWPRPCPSKGQGLLRSRDRVPASECPSQEAGRRQTPSRVQTSLLCAQKGHWPRGKERRFSLGALATLEIREGSQGLGEWERSGQLQGGTGRGRGVIARSEPLFELQSAWPLAGV